MNIKFSFLSNKQCKRSIYPKKYNDVQDIFRSNNNPRNSIKNNKKKGQILKVDKIIIKTHSKIHVTTILK